MAGIPPKRPSAIDGYRRLERTRSVVGASLGAATMGAVEPVDREQRIEPRASRRSSRLTRARVAGAVRLVGFVGVLALIVGTSVSIASADQRRGDATPAPAGTERTASKQVDPEPVEAKPVDAEPVERLASRAADTPAVKEPPATSRAADKPVAAPAEVADVTPEPAAAIADDAGTGTATGAIPSAPLPFTGELQVRWIVLGGSLLVLVGMLVQVAGQPLPARASRTR